MSNVHHLRFNDAAPDFELLDADAKVVRLASLWKKQAILLAFARHFGCPQCKAMLTALAGEARELQANGLRPVIVTQSTPREARLFCRQYARGLLCLSDPERRAYRGYGLERAGLFQTFLSPRVWRANARLRREHGWRTELPPRGQDAMQMAGLFVIGRDGRVRLPYYYDDIADHPPLDLLLHGVLGVNWKRSFAQPLVPARTGVRQRGIR
jgi:peroxiredoxin